MNIRNYLLFAVAVFPLTSYAWQTGAPPTAPCLVAGEMSGWDIMEHTLSLKSDSGHYSDLRYDDSTIFSDGRTTLPTLDLNVDDRICLQAVREGSEPVASRVLVTRRSQIDVRDRADLLEWERDSVFGTVKSLDTGTRRIVLRTPGGSDVLIDAAGPLASWTLPVQARDPTDAVPGNWGKVSVGDELYVRGERVPETGTIRARLIVSGGFRSFVGSIESMQPLTELLRLRDFRSGRSHTVHFDFTPIYIVGNASEPAQRRLYSGDVGDVKQGDAVLVLSRHDAQTGKIEGLLLITGFSRRGIVHPAPGESPDWIFKAVGFGAPPSR